MATLKRPTDEHAVTRTITNEPAAQDTPEARRRRRLSALKTIAGLWSNRTDIPADGLDCQREMRAEWR